MCVCEGNSMKQKMFSVPVPVSRGEAAAQLHVQRWLRQVQLEELQRGGGAEGGVQLLG